MQFFDLITVVTLSGILVILVLYILVVYKKGWLKRNSAESHFLCPNPKCRKIFTEPVWLTDLSKTPPESYPACPNCSIDLKSIPFFGSLMNPYGKSKSTAAPSLGTPTTTREREYSIQETVPTNKPRIVREVSKSVIDAQNPLAPFEKPKMKESAKSYTSSRDCPHYFGYVGSLPKNAPIPDGCLGCRWIVECLHPAEKVRA